MLHCQVGVAFITFILQVVQRLRRCDGRTAADLSAGDVNFTAWMQLCMWSADFNETRIATAISRSIFDLDAVLAAQFIEPAAQRKDS